ncbi:uncharacterized protein LOC110976121 [Acanthaster planci]|uniref:Uncharacterized protein LOC110976121 n=1 Tax=Acanthaster planci TaxID=133434 RepID=A0A8B7XVF0_ACAPL|nr:uncharacterized protein LOC110976121 [Acanthaster planci]
MLLSSVSVLLLLVSGVCSQGSRIIGRRPGVPNLSRPVTGGGTVGLCKFGRSQYGCCYGWKRNHFGGCSPVCQDKCVHGTCVGPNRCKCDRGFTGTTCERDLNECSNRPCSHRCMNTPGSFRCYCEHGYLLLEDGTSCSRDDRCSETRCAFGCIQYEDGFTCFCPDGLALLPNGLGCTDVDECASGTAECPPGRRCKNTYGNYMCLCPAGYKFAYVNGELDCVDENECDSNRCDANAICVNVLGGFQCKCNEGYVGDGYRCIPVDTTTCLDNPCFQDVECTDRPVNPEGSVPADGTTVVKQYVCGSCPPTFVGDGETCTPTTIPVMIVAVDPAEEDLPLAEVGVRALLDRDDGQTEIVAEGTTDLNGLVTLQVPADVPLELVASKDDYVDSVKTYRVHPEGGNVVSIQMKRFDEYTSFLYRVATSKAFEFGSGGEEKNFRLSLPEGALRASDGTRVTVNYKGMDVSSPDSLSSLPDLSQVEGAPGQRLIPLGAAELSILNEQGRKLSLRKPASISFILKDYVELLGIRDTVDAYYFDPETGKWVKDGSGTITPSEDGPTWTYETDHFTWWILAIVYTPNSCLTVRTCYDSACTQPAPNIPIIISGENFILHEEFVTGASGSICADVLGDEMNQVRVLQNCTGESQLVTANPAKSGLCTDGGDACQEVTFIIPDTVPTMCPSTGAPENGVRMGTDYSLGATVSFFCDPGYQIKGSSQRLCLQCGKWSGSEPSCPLSSPDSSSVGSGEGSLDI